MFRKIFFPFAKCHIDLHTKWWHRLVVVIFFISLISFLLLALAVSSENIPENISNLKIKNDLRDFSKESSTSTINTIPTNTIPTFLKQRGKFGCLQKDEIKFVSTYLLENKSICSADINLNIDEISKFINDIAEYSSTNIEELKKSILNNLNENNEKRYCFIHKNIDCMSDKIVNYDFNILYYFQVIIYSLLSTYLFSLFLQIIYYKGIIYIIYGKK